MRLFFSYLAMHLKINLEYKMSFILTSFSQVLVMFMEIFSFCAIFDKFKLLNQYDINELILTFSIVWLGYSISEFIGRGFDHFSDLIVDGSFDLLLIRPRNLYLQILGSNISFEKTSRIIFAFIIFSISVYNLNFNIYSVIALIGMLIGMISLIMGLLIIGAAYCFISIQGIEFINVFTNGTKSFGQYPMKIYNKAMKFIFTFIIPLSLINYYPIQYIMGYTTNKVYIVLPYLAVLFLIPAFTLFNIGLRKYESSGS